jgi:uncharacterized integral membrane protein
MSENTNEHGNQRHRSRRVADLGLIGLGGAVILLVWFAVANSTEVTISFWGYHSHTKVITVILLCAVLGGVVGFVLGRRNKKRPPKN